MNLRGDPLHEMPNENVSKLQSLLLWKWWQNIKHYYLLSLKLRIVEQHIFMFHTNLETLLNLRRYDHELWAAHPPVNPLDEDPCPDGVGDTLEAGTLLRASRRGLLLSERWGQPLPDLIRHRLWLELWQIILCLIPGVVEKRKKRH